MAALEPPIPLINLYLSSQGEYKLRMENIILMNTNLDQFTDLYISDCTLELTGYQVPIADAIRNMKNLTTLILESIELRSSTFLEIESKELKQLCLCRCETRLQIISLFKNYLCYKDSLVELNLQGNRWSEIPNGVFQFRNLFKLSLNDNHISELPDKFTNLPKLQKLDLSINRLQSLPPSIFTLQNLSELELMENFFTELPDKFANLSKLQVLSLFSNQLTHLPSSIFALQNLSELFLDMNLITELPDKFANLSKLKFLSLDRNQLRYVPSSIFALQHLIVLSLSDNLITELPDMFTNSSKLKKLSLSKNQLKHLPPSICSLHLKKLDIADNEFDFEMTPSVGCEMIVHSLKELSYRTILNHKLKAEEGMLPKEFLKDLANFCKCICGCKFVNGQEFSFFSNLKDFSKYIHYNRGNNNLEFPIRGKMCTSLKSCLLDRFTKWK